MLMPRALPRSALRTVFAVGLGAIRVSATPTPMPVMATMTAVAEHVHGDECDEKQYPNPVLRKPLHDLPLHSEKVDGQNIYPSIGSELIFLRKDRVVCAVAHTRGNILCFTFTTSHPQIQLVSIRFLCRSNRA